MHNIDKYKQGSIEQIDHKNVLKDIRELECSEEFSRLNFEQTSYTDFFSRRQQMYYIIRDGFTLLVMGYTGEKAMRLKAVWHKAKLNTALCAPVSARGGVFIRFQN